MINELRALCEHFSPRNYDARGGFEPFTYFDSHYGVQGTGQRRSRG